MAATTSILVERDNERRERQEAEKKTEDAAALLAASHVKNVHDRARAMRTATKAANDMQAAAEHGAHKVAAAENSEDRARRAVDRSKEKIAELRRQLRDAAEREQATRDDCTAQLAAMQVVLNAAERRAERAEGAVLNSRGGAERALTHVVRHLDSATAHTAAAEAKRNDAIEAARAAEAKSAATLAILEERMGSKKLSHVCDVLGINPVPGALCLLPPLTWFPFSHSHFPTSPHLHTSRRN